jgi:hypothetical protein
VLTAQGDSQLRLGPTTVIQSATIADGSLDVSSTGVIRQSGPIAARSLAVTALGGAVVLDRADNAVDAFSAAAGRAGVNVLFVNARGFVVSGTGVVAGTAGNLDGEIALTALTGDLTVAAPLTAPGDIAFLRAPAGRVVIGPAAIVNVQTLIKEDSTGTIVEGAFLVNDRAGLLAAVDRINALPNTGTPYEIILTASFTLDRTIAINNAVDLNTGGATGVVIDGGDVTAEGLALGPAASNSSISGVAFANFTGAAVSIDSAQNVSVRGITVSDSETGIRLAGDLTGTTVQGSTFRGVVVGMRLDEAKYAILGGSATEDRNRIEGARQFGVYATGLCTGSRLVRTTFTLSPGTRRRYNLRGSRNVRIQGTVVERPPRAGRVGGGGRLPFRLLGRRR